MKNLFRKRPLDAEGKPYTRNLIQNVMRVVMLLCMGLVALIGGIIAYEQAHNYFTYEIPKSQIKVTVNKNSLTCETQWPLLMVIKNDSKRTIYSVSAYLSARYPNRSTNYADYTPLNSDYIISPGHTQMLCFKALLRTYDPPREPEALEWGLLSFLVTFQP